MPIAHVKKVFLSYSSQDHELAQQLSSELQAGGVATITAEQISASGTNWQQRLEHAVRTADAVVVVVSAKGEPDRTQQVEWRIALEETWEKPKKQLIPLLLRNTPLPSFLSGRQVLRIRDSQKGWRKAITQLLHIFKGEPPESGTLLSVEREASAKRRARLQYIGEAAEALRSH
ncbi:MAG: toll/interleukin-1 receptor domain-containing protein [Candidatus Binatia bacterium]